MQLADFQFEVPPELVAQTPAMPRDSSRLMCVRRDTGEISHHVFRDLPSLLDASWVMVVNNSRVINARLWGEHGGKRVEVFLLKPLASEAVWSCLSDGQVPPGARVRFEGSSMTAERLADGTDGTATYRFEGVASVRAEASRIGEVPLPPYVREKTGEAQYQTVYAREDGSVAAPTAGLHFTPEVLAALEAKGIPRREITLHVSYGTFATVTSPDLAGHVMQTESYTLSDTTAATLNADRAAGKRILAVGTTSTRVLETCTTDDGVVHAGTGETNLFIHPPYRFKAVGGLVTNFHMPGLTPIMLTAALAGYELIMEAYRIAIRERYRFYSFGDSMVIL